MPNMDNDCNDNAEIMQWQSRNNKWRYNAKDAMTMQCHCKVIIKIGV